ncbi:MAG: methylenetetrahydrofolate--tRNA-(uracil(54)-C(5))-methyltransferase (FADH(2)-oxidizing) TrmFO [Nitrospira sp.]|nr:methylenetetrahydrofolate--tRNA-(uracil(54)-C(5))-methyltransferase (FADH(2)-oxidizing) TrmFO [Nitrospira sp.]
MNAAVVGGGLAGCEAAWTLAESGVTVTLYEMRPKVDTPAHQTDGLAELVCTNSFKSTETANAHGLLKAELRLLGSLLMRVAEETRVPAGAALAVDRALFSEGVTKAVRSHPNIEVVCEEITTLPSPGIVATGPLTSDSLAAAIQERLGASHLAFFDSIAPIILADSLDETVLYRLSRYGKGGGDDYLNAPFDRERYYAFIEAMVAADQYEGHDFDKIAYFEGCLPVEEMARRGPDTLRFGPMKPVGLPDPRTGQEPYAVMQLRSEDRAGQMWNMVGFQTRLRTGEQRKVFRLIPGLENAEMLRWGSVHRNTYLNTPAVLSPHLSARDDDRLLFAGQLVGVEGYTESLACGLLCGINLARILGGAEPLLPPENTMLGSLVRYVHGADPKKFQPMNANFGLLPPLPNKVRDKRKKREALATRALEAMAEFATRLSGVPT